MTPMYIFQIQLQLVVKFNFNTLKYTHNLFLIFRYFYNDVYGKPAMDRNLYRP